MIFIIMLILQLRSQKTQEAGNVTLPKFHSTSAGVREGRSTVGAGAHALKGHPHASDCPYFLPSSLPLTNPPKANFSTDELKPTFLCLPKDILLLLQNHPSYLGYVMILNSCHMHHHSHTPPSHSHSAPFFYSCKIKNNGLINGYRIG